jgi:hypothetical protein
MRNQPIEELRARAAAVVDAARLAHLARMTGRTAPGLRRFLAGGTPVGARAIRAASTLPAQPRGPATDDVTPKKLVTEEEGRQAVERTLRDMPERQGTRAAMAELNAIRRLYLAHGTEPPCWIETIERELWRAAPSALNVPPSPIAKCRRCQRTSSARRSGPTSSRLDRTSGPGVPDEGKENGTAGADLALVRDFHAPAGLANDRGDGGQSQGGSHSRGLDGDAGVEYPPQVARRPRPERS